LCMLIVYTIQQETTFRSNWLVAGVGLLFLVLGNFFKTIQPNYFVGIRTPWTLEHPTVWKKTHILGGKLWFVGGLVLVVLAFVLSRKIAFMGLTSITIVLVMVPVVYSYMVFQKIRKQKKIES
ncbi:MAG: SdpI family protein, partial [Flavobacteriaceae bacterium]|nr:SdpI family protein [Flavobacteriaceae bacterium]